MKQKVLLLGAPGSGKGTQAKYLATQFGYVHISMGDILRAEVESQSELGKKAKSYMDQGGLVPDDVVNNMVFNKLSSMANEPYLLDGFPRTIPQAEFLGKKGIAFDAVIYFKITLEAVLDRMAGRLTCKNCGASFHSKYNPPKKDRVCDLCQTPLIIREDDKPETVQKRFDTYLKQTQPLLEYYQAKKIVYEVDAEQDIMVIQDLVSAQVK